MGVGKGKKGKNLTREQRDLIVTILMQPESSKLRQDDLVRKINDELWRWYHRKLSDKYLKKKLIPQLKKKLPEEKAWCISSSEDVPLGAIPAVLRVCKHAQIIGKVLTIREAKWCAKLSGVIEDTRTLLSWASAYVNRETAWEALHGPGEPFDTSNLDMILTMAPWEMATACLTKEIKPLRPTISRLDVKPKRLSIFDAFVSYEPMTIFAPIRTMEVAPDILETQADDAQMRFILLVPRDSEDDPLTKIFGLNVRAAPWIPRGEFRDIRISMRKTLHELQFSQEQMGVYTMWLKYMATGPSVQELQFENRIKIVDELREWVKNHDLAKDSRVLLPLSPEWPAIEDKIGKCNLMPFGLLKKVGHKV